MNDKVLAHKNYLFASDFDQTLSFNDSGAILGELLGTSHFEEKVKGLSRINLVQQGGELAYLILHDPEYRSVRREHLREVGKRVRLKRNIHLLPKLLASLGDEHHFDFYVVSAAPEEVVQSALEGIVPADHIFGTRFHWNESTGEVESIARVAAGYGKVAVIDELQSSLEISPSRTVYVGDGTSDVNVMLHVNRRNGFTIAVSEAKYIAQIAQRTVMSDDALSVLIPILEDILNWTPSKISKLFETHGLAIHEWDKVRTDWLTIRDNSSATAGVAI